mmetsp:Transcript_5123/g.18723  ORF Transcript_5123/g.18723 Transcript_5123/m.18723 type:complete len:195 (-) Transcript_5123:122-706(-)
MHDFQVHHVKRDLPCGTDKDRDSGQRAPAGKYHTTMGELVRLKGRDAGQWLHTRDSATVKEAVTQMTDANVGALVVTDDAGTKMLGIITERDYLRKIVVQGRRSDSTRVKEIMTPENRLITVEPHVNVYDAMQIMTANRFRHIPVTTTGALDDGTIWRHELLGMVSIGDVVKALIEEHQKEMAEMESYIGGGTY